MASGTEKTVRELNALIETHLDAVQINKDALEGLQAPALQEDVRHMLSDHQQEAQRLQNRVRELGGEPATDPHATNSLTDSWQEIWTGGGDKEAMLALRANERVNVDGFKVNVGKEDVVQTMTDESLEEHRKAFSMEVQHFQMITDRLRDMGAAVDNDEAMGAVRNAVEHVHAAINLSGTAVEAFTKWATGMRG